MVIYNINNFLDLSKVNISGRIVKHINSTILTQIALLPSHAIFTYAVYLAMSYCMKYSYYMNMEVKFGIL